MVAHRISVIVPTVGRPESLTQLFGSLVLQSHRPDEVIVADGSGGEEVARIIAQPLWSASGLNVRRLAVQPQNAVRQRRAAIAVSEAEYLLLLDDDVVLEPTCVAALLDGMHSAPDVVAVTADFNNQPWSGPTTVWRWYLRWCHGLTDGEWQGRVVGPLLRFGYRPTPQRLASMEWLGAGNSLVRRDAYDQVGGFSDFFLHRSTMNEDVDLGLKLGRVGRILLCPAARMAHHHAPSGRVSAAVAAEDDLYNRYQVMNRTQGRSAVSAHGQVLLFFIVETASNLVGCLHRLSWDAFWPRMFGRLRALGRIWVQDTAR